MLESSLRDGNTRPPYFSPSKPIYTGQEAIVRARHGTMDWLQIGKGVVKTVYCHRAYLTSVQSTLC